MKKEFSFGIIASGNMAQAILNGIISKSVVPAERVYMYDIDTEKLKVVCEKNGINRATSNEELIKKCDFILIAVKPNVCQKVLLPLGSLFEDKVLLSIVTGWDKPHLQKLIHPSCRILRIMPNTPCLVGKGMSAFDLDHSLEKDEFDVAMQIFSSIGRVELVETKLMNAITGVSGSGPAYVYMFIEALADGGVKQGLPRATAYRLAAQTVLGAGAMVLETGKHPGELKDAVCSPGGTTIEAVQALERMGLRAAVMEAVDVCTAKAEAMTQK